MSRPSLAVRSRAVPSLALPLALGAAALGAGCRGASTTPPAGPPAPAITVATRDTIPPAEQARRDSAQADTVRRGTSPADSARPAERDSVPAPRVLTRADSARLRADSVRLRFGESLAELTQERVAAVPRPPTELGVEGPSVLRVQILLDQVGFGPGVLDGKWGDNAAKAAGWFRQAQRLGGGPAVDSVVVARLLKTVGGRAPLTRYTVTAADVRGPFVRIPESPYARAKLACLCYSSVLELLGERFHSSPELLQRLNPGVRIRAGAVLTVPNVERARPTGAVARLVVSKRGNYLHALDASGRILLHVPTTVGSRFDPSPHGEVRIASVDRDPEFHYNPRLYADVADHKPGAYLKAGPNSPVGVVWMALSRPHYGIHGTAEPRTIGYTTSHGCVRLTNWDASHLAGLVRVGVPVQFR